MDRGDEDPPSSDTYKKYVSLAEAMGERISIESQGQVDSFAIDLGDGAKMTLVSANGLVRGRDEPVPDVNTENEKSLCFHLSYGGFDYLNGGDTIGRQHGNENAKVEGAIGDYLVQQGVNTDVLHVNHHGANNGSDAEFLEAILPEIAVISMGNGNAHKHPNRETLERLVAAGVYRIYQTSWGTTQGAIPEDVRDHQAIFQGDIVITTDGKTFEVSTSRRFDVDE